MAKISILLAAYNSNELLKYVFFPSAMAHTSEDVELVIYDNGGNRSLLRGDSVLNWNKRDVRCCVIGDGKNIGLNAALNKCAKEATGDWFYLPHTDMYLLPGWDTALLKAAKNHAPHTILLCSRSIEKSSHTPFHVLKDFGTLVESFKEKELLKFFTNYKDKGIVTGYRMPFFGNMKLLNILQKYNIRNNICEGPFDESFWSYATDNDLFFNCYDIGVRKFWVIQESVVYHLSGQSNKQQTVDKDDKKPYIKLCEKWKKYNVTMNIDESENNLIPWNLKIK